MKKPLGKGNIEADAGRLRTLLGQGSVVTAASTKAKVSGNDGLAGYLLDKLVAGSGIVITELNDGGNETLEFEVSGVSIALNDLTDVVITSPGSGHGLRHNGTNWVNGDYWVELTGDTMTGELNIVPPAASIPNGLQVTINDPSYLASGGSAVLIEGDKPTGIENLYYLLRIRDISGSGDWFWVRSDGTIISNSFIDFAANKGITSNSSGATIKLTTGGGSSGDIEIDSTLSNGTGKHIKLLIGGNLYATKSDAVTNVLTDVLIIQHNTSGTPAAEFGTAVLLQGESSTTADQNMMRLGAAWETPTHAICKSYAVISVFDGGTEMKNVKVYTGEVQILNSNLSIETAGKTLHVKEGSNACMGVTNCSFINGEQETTISTTAVTASSRVFLSIMGNTSSMNNYIAAWVDPADISAGTSFKITIRGRGTGSCDILWWIVEPA